MQYHKPLSMITTKTGGPQKTFMTVKSNSVQNHLPQYYNHIESFSIWTELRKNDNDRKPKTNPDSVLKTRDITLPTKISVVKAMVFPVVMYGYELDHKES